MTDTIAPMWISRVEPEQHNARCANTLAAHLNMKITEVGPDFVKGTMPVDATTHQPMGLLHGGANVAFAETLGSLAANMMVDREKFQCVGQEINANHLRGVRSGMVTGVTKPVYIGRTSQVWEIKIYDEREKLTCISRITMAVIKKVIST